MNPRWSPRADAPDDDDDFALQPVVLDVWIGRREIFEGPTFRMPRYFGEDDLDAEWTEG